jgi:(p)ppGpp synthase/HD superfamily hydrolase
MQSMPAYVDPILYVDRLTQGPGMQLRNQFGDYAGGLEHALALATLAHATHREKAGSTPGLFRAPLSLTATDVDPDARTIALLHDVIAETDLTLEDLREEGFPEHILDAIDGWSRRRAPATSVDNERLARYQVALRILDNEQ